MVVIPFFLFALTVIGSSRSMILKDAMNDETAAEQVSTTMKTEREPRFFNVRGSFPRPFGDTDAERSDVPTEEDVESDDDDRRRRSVLFQEAEAEAKAEAEAEPVKRSVDDFLLDEELEDSLNNEEIESLLQQVEEEEISDDIEVIDVINEGEVPISKKKERVLIPEQLHGQDSAMTGKHEHDHHHEHGEWGFTTLEPESTNSKPEPIENVSTTILATHDHHLEWGFTTMKPELRESSDSAGFKGHSVLSDPTSVVAHVQKTHIEGHNEEEKESHEDDSDQNSEED